MNKVGSVIFNIRCWSLFNWDWFTKWVEAIYISKVLLVNKMNLRKGNKKKKKTGFLVAQVWLVEENTASSYLLMSMSIHLTKWTIEQCQRLCCGTLLNVNIGIRINLHNN